MDVFFVQLGIFAAVFIAILGVCSIVYILHGKESTNSARSCERKQASLLSVAGSGTPGKPEDVKMKELKTSSVTLTLSKPKDDGGSKIDSYFILMKEDDGEFKEVAELKSYHSGHTKELLTLVEHLSSRYQPRYYIMANTDKMSEEKVQTLESNKNNKYKIYKIPRSREVKQSWITTILSTLYASLHSLPLVFRLRPDIILCNGPGTCIPVCAAGLLLKIFHNVKVLYVESICRTETLSLSGKILYHFADSLIVQWPQLQQKYPKSVYIGRVV